MDTTNNPYKAPTADVVDKASAAPDDARMERLAAGQKLVVYAVLIYFIAAATNEVIGSLVAIPVVVSLVMSVVGLFKILSARDGNLAMKVLFFALLFVPLVNILVLVRINATATKTLREAGYKVGLMGASKPRMDG